MDNINFTGSFVIKNPGKIGWKNIMRDMIPESAFIKGNFLGKGNMYVASSDRYDNEIATYLINSNFAFNYYPNINLKSGVCNMPVNTIESTIKDSKVLTDKKEIRKYTSEVERKYIPKNYVREANDHISQTINALKQVEHIPVDFLKHFTYKGETIFVDRNGKLIAKASPNNPRGFNYIQIFPRYSTSEDMYMIKTDYTGQIHYITKNIDKLRLFKRDYLAAVNSLPSTQNNLSKLS